jgi:AraC family ethanolamine operon transcriptional activator
VPDDIIAFGNSFRSFDELRGQLRGVDVELIPLRGGPFSGETRTLLGNNFTFTAGRFVSDHRFRGGTHESQILLGMHFSRQSSVYYETSRGEPGDLTVHQPKAENFGSMGGTFEYAALSMVASELARITDGLTSRDTFATGGTHIRAPDDIAAAACDAIARLTKVAFDPANRVGAARKAMLTRSLVYPYLLVAAHGEREPGNCTSEPKSTVVQRAENWLDGEPPERLHAIDLCHALGLPLRTVQRAFHETLGIGPAHYVMRYRLHKARQILLACDPMKTRVTDVALDHGFWELGRFAGLYRKTYGERPSETLNRRGGGADAGSLPGGSARPQFPLSARLSLKPRVHAPRSGRRPGFCSRRNRPCRNAPTSTRSSSSALGRSSSARPASSTIPAPRR